MFVFNPTLPSSPFFVTHCYTILFLQKRLVRYSVLEIVPAHVWQNADCHLQSPVYQALHKTIKPFCLPLRGCYAMLDSQTPSSANSAARQALVLFFFCLLETVMKVTRWYAYQYCGDHHSRLGDEDGFATEAEALALLSTVPCGFVEAVTFIDEFFA